MKTILVPTDFSGIADNALTYACEFSKKMNTGVVLLHVYHIPVPTNDIPVVLPSEVEIRKIVMDTLAKIKVEYQQKYPEIHFKLEATLGMAVDEIAGFAQKYSCDLIIMGTHGASGLKEIVLGSNAASVIEKATCPVLTIPEHAVFNNLRKIVFAADYGQHNYDHMLKLIDMIKPFDSEIILLHISSGEADETFEDIEIGRFKERIVRDSNYTKISYRLIEDKDVFHGMNLYLEQNKPDLLAISMRHRSLFQKIFSRSLTRRLAYHSHVPVLALHIHLEK